MLCAKKWFKCPKWGGINKLCAQNGPKNAQNAQKYKKLKMHEKLHGNKIMRQKMRKNK